MARKKNVEKCDSDRPSEELAGRALHGHFTGHPLFGILQELSILNSYSPDMLKYLGLADDLDERFRQLGKWFYKVCTKSETDMHPVFEQVVRLADHLKLGAKKGTERHPVEKQRFGILTAFSKLATASGTVPSQKELRDSARGGRQDYDDRTLRREIKRLNLSLASEKTIERIRRAAETLSRSGKVSIDPAALRSRLQAGTRKKEPALPVSDHELLVLCACCGAKLDKEQLVQSFSIFLNDRHDRDTDRHGHPRPVTDFDLLASFPEWVREHYGLKTLTNLRAYAKSIGLRLRTQKGPDRDDICGRAPAR